MATYANNSLHTSVVSVFFEAAPNSTVRTRLAKLRLVNVSQTFFSTGATWTIINVLLSPPGGTKQMRKTNRTICRLTLCDLLYIEMIVLGYRWCNKMDCRWTTGCPANSAWHFMTDEEKKKPKHCSEMSAALHGLTDIERKRLGHILQKQKLYKTL